MGVALVVDRQTRYSQFFENFRGDEVAGYFNWMKKPSTPISPGFLKEAARDEEFGYFIHNMPGMMNPWYIKKNQIRLLPCCFFKKGSLKKHE
jgi:hypothetical protein